MTFVNVLSINIKKYVPPPKVQLNPPKMKSIEFNTNTCLTANEIDIKIKKSMKRDCLPNGMSGKRRFAKI